METLEAAIVEFEKAFDCRIMIHCHGRDFHGADGELLFDRIRLSHRKSFPALCGKAHTRDYCPDYHYRDLPDRALRIPERRVWIRHCRKGMVEVVSPLFRAGAYAATVYAGLWKPPLPRETLERIVKVLPVWAEGLLVRAAELRHDAQPYLESRREQITAFIARHYSGTVRTSDLAHELFLSTTHVCHLVKQLFGVSFSGLLMNERLSHAKMMLSESRMSVAKIAELCGFGSSEQFSRMFKRKTGVSPRRFRNDSK